MTAGSATFLPRLVRLLAIAVVLATAAFGAAACGGDGDDEEATTGTAGTETVSESGADVEEAQKRVEEAMELPEWESPGPEFDATEARGKTVWYISVNGAIPIVQTIARALKEASSLVGVKVVEFDGKGQVSEFNRGIQTAVAQKADVITLLAIPSSIVSGAIADAKQAGIPVVQVQEHDPDAPLADGVVGQVTFCYSCAGKMIADFVIADSGGDAEATIFVSREVSNGEDETRGMQEEFAELCPDCKTTVENVPIAEWNTRLPTLTRSVITRGPNVNYLLPLYDGMTTFMVPSVIQAGAEDRVKIVSFNATPSVMQNLGSGNVIAADVGGANVWFGWGLADQVFRVMAGEEPVPDENIPLRLFTSENIDTIDLDADESTWYGDVDFRAEYKKLWGLN